MYQTKRDNLYGNTTKVNIFYETSENVNTDDGDYFINNDIDFIASVIKMLPVLC